MDNLTINSLASPVSDIRFWAAKYVKWVDAIAENWRGQISSHLHALALGFNFNPDGFRPKNDLTDVELLLFLQTLHHFEASKEHWRQSYIVWVSVYLRGARSSSFAVGGGYEKGADMGKRKRRPQSETLRWSHLDFFRVRATGALAVRVTF
jgi:hypothetical protein